MSMTNIRAALENALNGMTPALQTAWENIKYVPSVGVPYQRCFILPANPDNQEFGSTYRDQGILQINLFYPEYAGSGAATARGELIRTTFYRGATFTYSTDSVNITRTPHIGSGFNDDDRYLLPVRVFWKSI